MKRFIGHSKSGKWNRRCRRGKVGRKVYNYSNNCTLVRQGEGWEDMLAIHLPAVKNVDDNDD